MPVKGTETVMFTSSYFHGEPKVTVSDGGKVNFVGCFMENGKPFPSEIV